MVLSARKGTLHENDGTADPDPVRQSGGTLGLVVVSGLLAASAVSMVVWGLHHVSQVSEGRIFDAGDVTARPVAMVLGAQAASGRPSAFLAARLDLAVELFEKDKIRAILVSGDNRATSNHETSVMREYLVQRGVPASQVVEDPAGFDTYDSCVRARDVFGVREMIVVTQEYHLARAITICTDIGVDAIGVGDTTVRDRFPGLYSKGERREWAANIKMEWDLFSRRKPRHDDYDPSLLNATAQK